MSTHWENAVARFLNSKVDEGRVGELWLRRMRWELLRVPSLLSQIQPGSRIDTVNHLKEHEIQSLRAGLSWERATWAVHFAALRQFLRWAGNPIAEQRALWKLPTGESSRRRWITKEQLVRLINQAQGAERVLVCLEGLNGLRRVEVLRLKVKDVMFDDETLRVLGKGRNGGKLRTIPMHPLTLATLSSWVKAKERADPILPISRSGADALLRRLALRSGFDMAARKVSHHDLRRTFGRLSYRAGMSLVQLKNLYGHSSLDQTGSYIGLDRDEMKAGLERFAASIDLSRPT